MPRSHVPRNARFNVLFLYLYEIRTTNASRLLLYLPYGDLKSHRMAKIMFGAFFVNFFFIYLLFAVIPHHLHLIASLSHPFRLLKIVQTLTRTPSNPNGKKEVFDQQKRIASETRRDVEAKSLLI